MTISRPITELALTLTELQSTCWEYLGDRAPEIHLSPEAIRVLKAYMPNNLCTIAVSDNPDGIVIAGVCIVPKTEGMHGSEE